MMQEITSYWHGYTGISQHDLIDRISRLGWQVEKIEHKPDGFAVKLSNQYGERCERIGKTAETALAYALIYLTDIGNIRRNSALQQTWTDQGKKIADAYAAAPVFDYKASPSWKHLADDDAARAKILKGQLAVEYTHEPVPYPSHYDMAQDIQKGKIKIPNHDIKHPVWTPYQHLDHRLVHAVLGQAPAGGAHDWAGTNMAVAHHLPYLSAHARQALFTEELGRKAYMTYHAGYGPRKIAHLSEFLAHKDPDGNEDLDLGDGESPDETRTPFSYKRSSVNTDWKSEIQAPFPSAFIDNDPLDWYAMKQQARKLHVGWDEFMKFTDDA